MTVEISRKALTGDDSCLWGSDQATSQCTSWKPSGVDPEQSTPVGNPPVVASAVCKGKGIRWRAASDNN